MIVVLYGNPGSGKTTLAKELQKSFFLNLDVYHKTLTPPIVDGDDIRRIFKNTDFSREGRVRNLQRISDIATFLQDKFQIVIISAVYPYFEAREYLNSICDEVKWVFLPNVQDVEKMKFFVKDFDFPTNNNENHLTLYTLGKTIEESVTPILDFIS